MQLQSKQRWLHLKYEFLENRNIYEVENEPVATFAHTPFSTNAVGKLDGREDGTDEG